MSEYIKDNKDSNATVVTGCSFLSLLQIAFIILKLLGKIDWSWVKVLIPLWIELGIAAVVFLVVIIVVAISKDY